MGGFGSSNFVADHPPGFGTWAGIVALLDFPNPGYEPKDNHSVPQVLGGADNWEAFNPIRKAGALRGKNILFITAEDAFDRKMNEAFSEKLSALGIRHEFRIVPGGHTFPVVADALDDVMRFFHKHQNMDIYYIHKYSHHQYYFHYKYRNILHYKNAILNIGQISENMKDRLD